MGGGNLNHAYFRVNDIVDDIKRQMTTPLHRAFAEHLLKVSKALHDLEWMFSGDTKPGDEVESIRAIVSPQEELAHTIERANIVLAELKDCLERVEHGKVN